MKKREPRIKGRNIISSKGATISGPRIYLPKEVVKFSNPEERNSIRNKMISEGSSGPRESRKTIISSECLKDSSE